MLSEMHLFPSMCYEGWPADRGPGPHDRLLGAVTHMFNRALAQGRWASFWDALARRSNRLLDLNAATLCITGRHAIGLHSVPLDAISGTFGRPGDFDRRFCPRSDRLRERWQGVALARLQGTALPAVSLILVGDCYGVLDGHHRVSVARALRADEIDAEVTRWEVAGPLPWDLGHSPRAGRFRAGPRILNLGDSRSRLAARLSVLLRG